MWGQILLDMQEQALPTYQSPCTKPSRWLTLFNVHPSDKLWLKGNVDELNWSIIQEALIAKYGLDSQ